MELSQDKRETLLILFIEVINVIIALILLSFFSYLRVKILIVLFAVLLFLLFCPKRYRESDLFRKFVVYSGIVVFFIPLASSLNYSHLMKGHLLLLFLLILIGIMGYIAGINRLIVEKREFIFALILNLFMILLIIIISYAPIRDEFKLRADIEEIVFKSTFLLIFFFMLFIDIKLLEFIRYSSKSVLYRLDKLIIVYLITLICLSFYDTYRIGLIAQQCIKSGYSECKKGPEEISRAMWQKGLDVQNIEYLKGWISEELKRSEDGGYRIIELSERLYPYECDFYNVKIDYLKRTQRLEELKRLLDNPPAPIRRACKR